MAQFNLSNLGTPGAVVDIKILTNSGKSPLASKLGVKQDAACEQEGKSDADIDSNDSGREVAAFPGKAALENQIMQSLKAFLGKILESMDPDSQSSDGSDDFLQQLLGQQQLSAQQQCASAPPSPEELANKRTDAIAVLQKNADKFGKHGISQGKISDMIKDPKTSPELKGALTWLQQDESLKGALDGAAAKNGKTDGKISAKDIRTYANKTGSVFNQGMEGKSPEEAQETASKRMDSFAILQRYGEYLKKSPSEEDRDKMINDPKTPPELASALKYLKTDKQFANSLDAGKCGKTDGRIGFGDIKELANSPAMVKFNQEKAKTYESNYISSDVTDGNKVGRPITKDDAMKELYKYSDYLPKKINKEKLQEIVDGTGGEQKRPPQLIAAAKYMLDHPSDWEDLTGKKGNDSISRNAMNDNIGKKVRLDENEHKTVDTLKNNMDYFLNGKKTLDRKRLQEIVNDKNAKPEVAEAAKKLLDDPMLFGVIENAKHGTGGNLWNKGDDGKMSKGDLDKFIHNMNPDVAPAKEPPKNSKTADPEAVNEMLNGQLNQPDTKKPKGGALKDVVNVLLKGISIIEHIGSTILGGIAALKIPGISQLAALGSMATNAIGGAADIGRTALNDGDVKKAGITAAISFGANAISSLTAPGAGNVMTKAAGSNISKVLGNGAKVAGGAEGAAASTFSATGGTVVTAATNGAKEAALFAGSEVTKKELYGVIGKGVLKGVAKEGGGAAYDALRQNQQQLGSADLV